MGSFPEKDNDPFLLTYYFQALVIQANMKYFLSNTYQLKVGFLYSWAVLLPKCSKKSSLSELKHLDNTNSVVFRHMKRENASLPVDGIV